MKKSIVVFVVMAFVASSLFAAGAAEKTAVQQGMTFSNWSGSEKASVEIFTWMIDTFNQKVGAEDQVVQINWPWGETESQLAIRAQGKEQYDIAQIDIRMLPALAEAGVLADLTEVFGKDFFTSNFSEGSIAVGNFKGTQYGVPWTVAPMALISNPKILKEAGVDFPIVTIADFERACEMVKNNHPANKDSNLSNDIVAYAAMTKESGTAAPDLMVWLWTFGASVYDEQGKCVLDSEKAVQALTWFNSLMQKGYIQQAMARGDARTLFKEGRVAFYDDALMSKGAITNPAFGDISTYAFPQVRPVLKQGDKPQASGWGHLLVIIDRSPKKAQAKAFIEHLISEEVALRYFKENGMLPSKKSVLSNQAVVSDYWSNAWTPVLDGGRLAETAGPLYAAANQVILEELQAMLSGSKTPSQAGSAMASRIDTL
ncbi:MAG: extracellular solute-binding protein [Sphaerochaeta sp.]|jgi:multiple sugar transport system substrate-binding protein|uniref:ABC transporter substrate-binding protein n=1 Tax=Sphaerochaeta sp. TaxID=1972642 RepID=UPI002A370592|nr:extracellular solute-binding protein [Sphaerochaeta sp.]MDX9824381.1 extracellular solute-binding protein [Sphaerochaeta sp.]